MNKIVCEMCGSNDLLKQDGVFICQYCGMKYSAEDVKKMMIEGTVDVQGTVKVDNSSYVEKFLQNARRAKQKEDWSETEKYYNMVEQYDPKNIEAIFYSSYGKAKVSLLDGDLYKRQAAFKVLNNCVSLIDDNFEDDDAEKNKEVIKEISNDIIAMACSEYVFNQRKNGYGIVTWSDKLETVSLFNTLGSEFVTTLQNIAQKVAVNDKMEAAYYLELALFHCEFILKNGSLANPQLWKDKIMNLHKDINKYDSSHEIPEAPPAAGAPQSGCYVATAVYGSYDCPQVWTLRRYRDYILSENWYGKLFIKVYYAISPTIVKWFGDQQLFKNFWKKKLDKFVDELNHDGVEDTPYEDRNW